ncbi:hypothetical protein GEV33_001570 [Tenebrio molitor]|jgi:hypothetical protein|uniref:Reverse transcriptase/retrotransposon-derived protein RNase H-like domain-containing protein n=1 Tax=Tenebrio molitor TaxID=7067 RepID=A0A8J6HSY3_TENMO|nr:hypothetical protein GEV33_001570 [Tenebrio molitor]
MPIQMFQQWMTTTPVAAGATQVCCYGCQRPGIHRKNCPTCNVTDSGTSALNGFCTLKPMAPPRSPTVSVSISGVQESAIVGTVACYSVASAGLDKHLLATGHPTQKVIVKATLADNDVSENGPLPPTSRITQPVIHDGRNVWSAYQTQGSSDYIMQDAADALMDYEMESSSGYDSPIRIRLTTLHLHPVEGASLPEQVELFAKTGPPNPFAENQVDTGDSTPIASPPYRLTPGKRQILQTEIHAMLEAFQTLKKQLTSTPVLRTADRTCALDAALLQGEAPEECPIEYASRLLTKTEKNYSTGEREVLANVWTINKFRSYVKETSIVVIIDCRPLPWLIALKPPPNFFNSTKAGRKLERPMKRSKLAPRRDRPYIVLQKNGPTSYVLAARDKPAEPLGTYHVSQLTPYLESEDAAPKPIPPIKKRGRPRKKQVQSSGRFY